MKTETKIISVNISIDSLEKLDRVAETIGRRRSTTLERLINAVPEKSMIRYTRRNPVYADQSQEGLQNEGNNI